MTSLSRTRVFVALAVVLATGCSDGGVELAVVAQGENEAQGEVGPEGGQLVLANGSSIQVPQGAVNQPVELKISRSDGLPPKTPMGPGDRQPSGPVVTTEPHGQEFNKDVEVRVAMPAGLSADRVTLYTHSGAEGTAWQPVPGVTFDEKKRTGSARTGHFSHWAWFEVYPTTSPEDAGLGSAEDGGLGGGSGDAGHGGAAPSIPTMAVLDTDGHRAYWAQFLPALDRHQLVAADLSPGAPFEVLYEETAGPSAFMQVVAVGPEGVFFYRSESRTIGRVDHGGGGLQASWATVTSLSVVTEGFVTPTHLYLGSTGFRIPLATGVLETSPVQAGRGCALSPDRKRAACVGFEYDLEGGSIIQPMFQGTPVGNGGSATDGAYWYFTPSSGSAPIYKAAYGSNSAELLAGPYVVDTVALFGSTLFIGSGTTIRALDTTSGTERAVKTVPPDRAPDALLEVDPAFVYYGIFGGTVQQLPLSDFGL